MTRERSFAPRTPVDVRRTLWALARGIVDPTFLIVEGEVWRATRTPDGPATINVGDEGGSVKARAWGPGAEWALEQAPELLGEEDDRSGFSPHDGRMRHLARTLSTLKLARSTRIVEVLIPTIIEQRVQGMEARRSYRRLTEAVSEPAPGPIHLLLPPDPAVLAEMPYYEFHRFGIERRRADVIRNVCIHRARLEHAAHMSPGDAERLLTAVPGVGPWTASYVRRLALGDPDSVIVGDYNLPNVVAWVLAGERKADDVRMLQLLEPYAGQRGRAMLLIEASGVRPPRRAPRSRGYAIEHI